jgi:hypothetical protein
MRHSIRAIGCVPQPHKIVWNYNFVQITNGVNVDAKLDLAVLRPCCGEATCYTSKTRKYGNTVLCLCNSVM